jgi:hypothetical protein
MPDRGIEAPCDDVCVDEDGCSMRGWTAKELEAILPSYSQRAAPVVIRATPILVSRGCRHIAS